YAVLVVDLLAGQKFAAEHFGHDEAVLGLPASTPNGHANVTLRIDPRFGFCPTFRDVRRFALEQTTALAGGVAIRADLLLVELLDWQCLPAGAAATTSVDDRGCWFASDVERITVPNPTVIMLDAPT